MLNYIYCVLHLLPTFNIFVSIPLILFRMVILSRMFNITGKACSNGSLSSLNKFLNKTMSKSSFSTNQSIKFQQRIDPKLRFQPRTTDTNTQNLIWYTMGGLVIMGGMSYAAVPLFKIFCESQGKITIISAFKLALLITSWN